MKWLLGNVSRLYGKKLTMMGDSCQNVDLNWTTFVIHMILGDKTEILQSIIKLEGKDSCFFWVFEDQRASKFFDKSI